MDSNELDYDKITDLLKKRDEEEKAAAKKKVDWVNRWITILNIAAWCMLITVWVLIEYASPEREMKFITTFFNVHFGTAPLVRIRWNAGLVYVAYVVMLFAMGTCLISFVLNTLGLKSKGKKRRISVLITSGFTLIIFVLFLLNFSSILF